VRAIPCIESGIRAMTALAVGGGFTATGYRFEKTPLREIPDVRPYVSPHSRSTFLPRIL
jgi:hypothetical protein